MAEQAPIWRYYDAITAQRDASIVDEPDFEKNYNAFILNRGLSYHEDCVLAAAVLNERPWLAKKLQALYLINTLRPRKRYSKWLKATISDDAKVIAEYYGVSLRVARDLVSLHSSETLTTMLARLDKGGLKRKREPRHDQDSS